MILFHALLVGCSFWKFCSLDKKMNFKFVFRWGFLGGANGKGPPEQCRRLKRCRFDPLGQEDPLEEGMAAHCSLLAWEIQWAEEPGRLGSHRVRHN